MYTVGQLLDRKGREVWSVTSTATVFEALELMADKDIGAVLVIDEGEMLGIFSERDYARKVILKGRSSKETLISELMTRVMFTVDNSKSMHDCMKIMTDNHIRHLPVLDNGAVVGIVTIGDAVKQIISSQEFTIQELEKYING